jgi:hypothetical protein
VRAFGDLGFGFRRLITDPTPRRLYGIMFLEQAGLGENRTGASDASSDITWTGMDNLRLAVGGAYEVHPQLSFELSLNCAFGSFRHVETSQTLVANLDPNNPTGFALDLREDTRKGYVIFGLALSVRGSLLP